MCYYLGMRGEKEEEGGRKGRFWGGRKGGGEWTCQCTWASAVCRKDKKRGGEEEEEEEEWRRRSRAAPH